MAFAKPFNCKNCGTDFHGYVKSYFENLPLCEDCLNIKKEQATSKLLETIKNTKSIEQRLEDIERWIIEHKQVKHGYIPEPRF